MDGSNSPNLSGSKREIDEVVSDSEGRVCVKRRDRVFDENHDSQEEEKNDEGEGGGVTSEKVNLDKNDGGLRDCKKEETNRGLEGGGSQVVKSGDPNVSVFNEELIAAILSSLKELHSREEQKRAREERRDSEGRVKRRDRVFDENHSQEEEKNEGEGGGVTSELEKVNLDDQLIGCPVRISRAGADHQAHDEFKLKWGRRKRMMTLEQMRAWEEQQRSKKSWKEYLEKMKRRCVPSLVDLCFKVLVNNADAIVSLEAIPEFHKRKLSNLLCDSRRMNAEVMDLFLRGSPQEIYLKDTSWITEDQFKISFASFAPNNLRSSIGIFKRK